MEDSSPSEVMADSSTIMNVDDSDLQDTEEIDNLPDNQDECSDNIIKSITTAEKSEVIKFTRLPMSRIKHIMKMDPDVNLASNDAVFAVTKATEMFIESIAKECYSYTAKAKKKIVTKKDFDAVIDTVDCLSFLEGAMDF